MPLDLTILGAGVTGLACAFEAARRGARVRVIDPSGVASGASGGVVGALMPHAPERWTPAKAFQLESLLLARRFWPEVEAASGRPTGYARTGRLQPLADAPALERARRLGEGARLRWRGAAAWEIVGAPDGDDPGAWAPASPMGLLVRDTLSAQVEPVLACDALAHALRGLGGEIVREAPHRGAVLHATGHAGLAALSEGRPRAVGVAVKGQAARLAHAAWGRPQIYVAGLHAVAHPDGTVGVGSTSEAGFDDPASTDGLLDDVIARARAAIPALARAPVVGRWAGLRPRARTRGPILGPWPGRPGHFIANGGFKIGLGLAPGVARTMADLILDGPDAILGGAIPEGMRVEDAL